MMQLTLYGPDRDPMLDVCGINIENNGDGNSVRSHSDLGKLKAHWSIGITAQYPVPLSICAELEAKMLTPRHALIRNQLHQHLWRHDCSCLVQLSVRAVWSSSLSEGLCQLEKRCGEWRVGCKKKRWNVPDHSEKYTCWRQKHKVLAHFLWEERSLILLMLSWKIR